MSDAWVAALADSPWLCPALFALVVCDAFVVVLPSETAVVALAALAGATGHPALWLVIPVAAVGAWTGDFALFQLGRLVGHDRFRWQREGRVGGAFSRVRSTVLQRPAVLVFTARYIPFARIAVNLSAGASGLRLRRFLPLSMAAGTGWALYNSGIGLLFGASLPTQPILAVALSVGVAIALGVAVDLVSGRISRWRRRRREEEAASQRADAVGA
jgi:membrane protein DedA with SNARE-associated domain